MPSKINLAQKIQLHWWLMRHNMQVCRNIENLPSFRLGSAQFWLGT